MDEGLRVKRMTARNCRKDGCKDKNGNCPMLGEDGFPVQCVGPWVEDKYFFLERYLNVSRKARKKFSDRRNAVFIDLFAGPGRCIIRDEKREIDGGAIIALNRDEAPFNECIYFDISEVNVEALKKRLKSKENCNVIYGDSNVEVKELVERLLESRWDKYHFAFIDPFGPRGLKFNTLRELAKLKKMDMLIHFPIGAIRRNLKIWAKHRDTILDDFLGTDIWRKKIEGLPNDKIFKVLIEIFKEQLKSIGYLEEGLKMVSSDNNIYTGLPTVPVKNIKQVGLYVLILASKHPLGQKMWSDVIKASPDGQKTFL